MDKNKYVWHKFKNWLFKTCKKVVSFKFIVLIILTIYVIKHWEECIKMEFFSEFNGNNILFVIWILMILLQIYDVNTKWVYVTEKKKELEHVHSEFEYLGYNEQNLKKEQEKQNIENDKVVTSELEQNKENINKSGREHE